MTKSAKPALQTKTTPNQSFAMKSHIYTMAAAFAGVVFGVLGSMGFVGSYLDSQFAAQTAALDQRIVSAAPASASSSDLCYGTSTASTGVTAKPVAKTAAAHHDAAMPAAVGGKGGESTQTTPNRTTPFVNQMISGSISNTGPNSTATINQSNNYTSTTNNTNNVNVSNSNSQNSSTGSATSSTNTNGGAAQSGASSNQNHTSTNLNIQN